MARAIKTVTGIDTDISTTGGTSDGRFIADICPQVVEFGPTNATIHKINECIALRDLTVLPRIYGKVLEYLLCEMKRLRCELSRALGFFMLRRGDLRCPRARRGALRRDLTR